MLKLVKPRMAFEIEVPMFTTVTANSTWVVVKIMVPVDCWVLVIIRHLIFRVPNRGTIILTTAHMHPKQRTPTVQVPSNHILSEILTYITTILKPSN